MVPQCSDRSTVLEDYALCFSFLSLLVNQVESRRAVNVLEIGCGTGFLGLCVSVLTGAQVVGTEMSPVLASIASKRIPCIQTPSGDLPFRDRRFDLIYCKDVLPATPDHGRLIAQIREALRPGGAFVTYMPENFDYEEKPLYRVVPGALSRSKEKYGTVGSKVEMLKSNGFGTVDRRRLHLREVPVDPGYVAKHEDGYFSNTSDPSLDVERRACLRALARGLTAVSDHGLLLFYTWERTVLIAE